MDYANICFVVMPFGLKDVGSRKVDFDMLFAKIFAPAILAAALPEGGRLEPHRTDRDFFTGDIKFEMFNYLEYSRIVLADISGLNFNVAYELGARHRARQSGTVIFRQTQFSPPFDISSVKAFPYEYEPLEQADEARKLITRVLVESLQQNRLDSPVWIALSAQQRSSQVDRLLNEAENAVRMLDWTRAMDIYRQAIKASNGSALIGMKLGLLCRDRGIWYEALEQFAGAVLSSPSYGEAYREKGIVENKIAQFSGEALDTNPAPGELNVRRAIELNSKDFDAYASLGGILKRAKRFKEALTAYERSSSLSGGHPYPLLNALKLRVPVNGRLAISGLTNSRLCAQSVLEKDNHSRIRPSIHLGVFSI